MKTVAFIPRAIRETIPQDIEGDLDAANIAWVKDLSSTGCTYLVEDDDYAVAKDIIEDPYKVVE